MIDLDHQLFHWLNGVLIHPVLDFICPYLRNRNTWIPAYLLGAVLLLYRYRIKGLYLIVFACISVGLSDLVSNLIKHVVHRLRPCMAEAACRLLLDSCSPTYSFTSNHAANHFALAVFLLLVFSNKRWMGVALILWAAIIGYAQIYVGLHYPADIVGGAFVGSIIAYLVFRVYVWVSSEQLITFIPPRNT